jgi:engulfment and cell motility protein 1
MDLQYGWSNLDEEFIFKVVQILSSPQSLINVCRPATAILKKLVEADPHTLPGPTTPGSSKAPPPPPPGSVFVYGFAVVWDQMRKDKRLLETVISRLGSADTALTLYRFVHFPDLLPDFTLSFSYSMMLINSLLAHADESRCQEFLDELEKLNVRKAVVVRLTVLNPQRSRAHHAYQRLMSSHTIEDLTSCILDFQANMVRATYRRKTFQVDPVMEPSHSAALAFIWTCSRLTEEESEDGLYKWRKLGFNSEDLSNEFSDVGVLGLDCMVCPLKPIW